MSNKVTIEIEFKGIPNGALTLEEAIDSEVGQGIIRILKKTSDDPLKLVVPFLMSYQFMDMKHQLKDRYSYFPDTSEINEQLLELATRHVVLTLNDIVTEIGESRLKNLEEILSPEHIQHNN